MNSFAAHELERADGGVPGISPDIYSAADFARIARLVRNAAGIVLADNKSMLAYSRLALIVRESGCSTFGAFLETAHEDAEKLEKIVTALTTNHTYFNREAHHFAHFSAYVRPALVERLLAGETARIWSAGCSTGEEAWSLALAVLGKQRAEGRRIAMTDVRVLATDIARNAINRARTAQYAAEALGGIPEELRRVWITTSGSDGQIAPEAQKIVRFRPLNLIGKWPMTRKFDAIFCRNVMIYFGKSTNERLTARLAEMLVPGGHLYIGHSERARGPAQAMLDAVAPTVYRKKSA